MQKENINVRSIDLNATVYDLCATQPTFLGLLHEFGIVEFDDENVRESLGRVLHLRTLLAHRRIDIDDFIKRQKELGRDAPERISPVNADAAYLLEDNPTLLALFPCGMKAGLDGALFNFAHQAQKSGRKFNYRTVGNLNHEISFYPFIDSIESEAELPDLVLSADLNAFYHRRFVERFIERGIFENVRRHVHPAFEALGYCDPRGSYTMFNPNVLVLVRVKDTVRNIPMPAAWTDLTEPVFSKTTVMRGQGEFFCSGVLVPFFKLFGFDGLKKLASTVILGCHPSQMVKQIDSGRTDIPPLYIMPLFFAKKIKREDRIDIIFPEEGAFISPVMLLVKKEARKKLDSIIDFLMSREIHQLCADNYFLSLHPEIENKEIDIGRLYWIGWDFIYRNDMNFVKREIGNVFSSSFLKKGTVR